MLVLRLSLAEVTRKLVQEPLCLATLVDAALYLHDTTEFLATQLTAVVQTALNVGSWSQVTLVSEGL